MVLEVSYQEASWADLPMRFEAGTPNIADSIGLGSAVDYLNNLGMENVRKHEKDLISYALNRFQEAGLEGMDLFGPDDPEIRGGVFSFNTVDVHPHDMGTFLDRMGIAVRTGHHCAIILIRPISAGCKCFGGGGCSTRTPSTRYFTLSSVSNGSI